METTKRPHLVAIWKRDISFSLSLVGGGQFMYQLTHADYLPDQCKQVETRAGPEVQVEARVSSQP